MENQKKIEFLIYDRTVLAKDLKFSTQLLYYISPLCQVKQRKIANLLLGESVMLNFLLICISISNILPSISI